MIRVAFASQASNFTGQREVIKLGIHRAIVVTEMIAPIGKEQRLPTNTDQSQHHSTEEKVQTSPTYQRRSNVKRNSRTMHLGAAIDQSLHTIDKSRHNASLHESSSREMTLMDINASIHIRRDAERLSSMSSWLHEKGDRNAQEGGAFGTMDADEIARACAKAQKQFESDISNSAVKDFSSAFPAFTEQEVQIGRFLGRGNTGKVSQVHGFRIKNTQPGDFADIANGDVDHEGPREFIMKNCYRDSGDARYAIKQLRPEAITDSYLLVQGITDLNLETRFLSHLTMNPHANIIKLRAVASGDRFSPNYFIVIDRLYDTLETRLEKWIEKSKRLDSPGTRLKSLLSNSNRRLSLTEFQHQQQEERSMLLDNQLPAALGLASAIAHLHRCNIMHRDLKPANLGFDSRGNIKVRSVRCRCEQHSVHRG